MSQGLFFDLWSYFEVGLKFSTIQLGQLEKKDHDCHHQRRKNGSGNYRKDSKHHSPHFVPANPKSRRNTATPLPTSGWSTAKPAYAIAHALTNSKSITCTLPFSPGRTQSPYTPHIPSQSLPKCSLFLPGFNSTRAKGMREACKNGL